MQIENDYDKEVDNGDIGYVDDVDPDAGELIASFDGRAVTYGFGELDAGAAAVATIHKSQGSNTLRGGSPSSPSITPCCSATRRGQATWRKRLVVLVGQKKAVAIAVKVNVSDVDAGPSE